MRPPSVLTRGIIIIIRLAMMARGQLAGTELTMRTFNSVDIEICADSVPSTEQTSLQSTVQSRLQGMLLSTAVYFTRLYTMADKGTVCYMFVYQARSPDEARGGIQTLLVDTSTIAVTYKSTILTCPITAVPWVGEDIGPLGLDWTLTAGQVLLWGGCGGGLLAMCAVGACCFLQLSGSRESKRADRLLAKERRWLLRLSHRHSDHSNKKDNTNNNNIRPARGAYTAAAGDNEEEDEDEAVDDDKEPAAASGQKDKSSASNNKK